jgi:hypothetical protein
VNPRRCLSASLRTACDALSAYSRVVTCALTLLVAVSASAVAQAPPPPPGVNAPLDSARALRGQQLDILLTTYGPGDDVWEKFGHDAIDVRDLQSGEDVTYNWGMFSFDQPNFLWKFLTGDTRYWMEGIPTPLNNAQYVQTNRSIRMQHLALNPVERAALAEFLAWNALEANKYYRYDYYRDNCASRVRDALDYVLKGRLKAVLDTGETPRTWRSETARVTASDPLVYPGIEMALGRNADNHLSRWTESFMPERLADAMSGLVIRNDQGLRYRIVDHDSVTSVSTRVPMPIDPPERVSMALLLGFTIAGIIAFLADSRYGVLRALLVTIVTLWYLIDGVLGTALLLAGTVTKHAPYMGRNLTLWEINPLLLLAAVVVPFALWRRSASAFPRRTAYLVAILSAIGALLQLVPAFAQHSGVVIAVILPVHIAIAVALVRSSGETARRAASAAALPLAA